MYNNIKKIALSLLVACLAVGFSAFTSAEKLTSITYYQLANDSYWIAEPDGTCDVDQPTTDLPCSITYPNVPSPTPTGPFSYSSRPEPGNSVPSVLERIYVEF